jgi:hypothetical protein
LRCSAFCTDGTSIAISRNGGDALPGFKLPLRTSSGGRRGGGGGGISVGGARVIDDIGHDKDGKPIDILFGGLSMQEWGIRLDVPKERLDALYEGVCGVLRAPPNADLFRSRTVYDNRALTTNSEHDV